MSRVRELGDSSETCVLCEESGGAVARGDSPPPSPWSEGAFGRRLQAMRRRLANVPIVEGPSKKLRAYPLSSQRWPREWPAHKVAAGRFLAHFASRIRARDWGDHRGSSKRVPLVWRPPVKCQCCYGQNLASGAEFEDQASRARLVADWDRAQSHLLKRLESGRTPLILDLFCCSGGVSEGFRRGGCTSFGVDLDEQPSFVARFGTNWFHLGSALNRETLRDLVRRLKPIAVWASPPCEASSTATFGGGHESNAPRLIAQTRDALKELGLPYIIENVRGAAPELSPDSLMLRGQEFGLETERPRLFEAGNGLVLEPCRFLAAGGAALRERSCLGERARYAKLDHFGRRFTVPCCKGNLFPVMGTHPSKSSASENARAMGVDVGHMPFARLAKAIPPIYSAYLLGFMVRHTLRQRFGVAALTYDEALRDLPRARRQMRHLLRGAGGDDPRQGVELAAPEMGPAGPPAVDEPEVSRHDHTFVEPGWGISQLAAREIEISFAGGCDALIAHSSVDHWLSDIRRVDRLGLGSDIPQEVENVLVLVHPADVPTAARSLVEGLKQNSRLRSVVLCLPEDEPAWRLHLRGSARVVTALSLGDSGGLRSVGGSSPQDLLTGAGAALALAVNERSGAGGGIPLDLSLIHI